MRPRSKVFWRKPDQWLAVWRSAPDCREPLTHQHLVSRSQPGDLLHRRQHPLASQARSRADPDLHFLVNRLSKSPFRTKNMQQTADSEGQLFKTWPFQQPANRPSSPSSSRTLPTELPAGWRRQAIKLSLNRTVVNGPAAAPLHTPEDLPDPAVFRSGCRDHRRTGPGRPSNAVADAGCSCASACNPQAHFSHPAPQRSSLCVTAGKASNRSSQGRCHFQGIHNRASGSNTGRAPSRRLKA